MFEIFFYDYSNIIGKSYGNTLNIKLNSNSANLKLSWALPLSMWQLIFHIVQPHRYLKFSKRYININSKMANDNIRKNNLKPSSP